MKKFLLVLLIFLRAPFLYGQDAKADSINRVSAAAKSDSSNFAPYGQRMQDLIWSKTWSNPTEALHLVNEELEWARKSGNKNVENSALSIKATILSVLGDYAHAIEFYLQAIRLSEKAGFMKQLIFSYLNLGEVYSEAGDFNNGIAYAKKGLRIMDTMHLNKTDSFAIMIAMTTVGEVFEIFGKLDSALYYLKSAHLLDSLYFGNQSGFTFLHLGNVYAKRNQAADAIKYYRRTILESKNHNYQSDLMDACNGLAKVFNQIGEIDSATFYAKETLLIGNTTGYPLAILDAVTVLSKIYKSRNELDSTVKYMEMSMLIGDSLFNRAKVRQVQDVSFNEQLREQELQQAIQQNQLKYRNRLNVYLLISGLFILLIVAAGLWRRNIFKQKSLALVQKQKEQIQSALTQLKSTQSQLIQTEKMASLGELTAGIAHEIQNPLNFINNFSEVNRELLGEMKDEIERGNFNGVRDLANNLIANEEKINLHGQRADSIVKGMLQHSKSSTGIKEPTNINSLVEEYFRLAYLGLRARDKSFNADMKTNFDPTIQKIWVVPQEIGRVLLNLFNNAFYAVSEKKKQFPDRYEPSVDVTTKNRDGVVEIRVKDNGNGIPQKVFDKIFQPFFTTKPTGQGTGLGLSLSYDIVKAHGGEIMAETREGEGSEFILRLPILA